MNVDDVVAVNVVNVVALLSGGPAFLPESPVFLSGGSAVLSVHGERLRRRREEERRRRRTRRVQ